ncbi:MAG: acyl carrier protein [Rhodobacteraceae bacterium]|nr:acyl carrier protein [Paracoccaceae bacterium]
MSVKKKITEILADQALLSPEDVSASSTLESLGIDSMGLVEVIFAIEEVFDIQVPFNANDPAASDFDISSVKTIVTAIESLLVAQEA